MAFFDDPFGDGRITPGGGIPPFILPLPGGPGPGRTTPPPISPEGPPPKKRPPGPITPEPDFIPPPAQGGGGIFPGFTIPGIGGVLGSTGDASILARVLGAGRVMLGGLGLGLPGLIGSAGALVVLSGVGRAGRIAGALEDMSDAQAKARFEEILRKEASQRASKGKITRRILKDPPPGMPRIPLGGGGGIPRKPGDPVGPPFRKPPTVKDMPPSPAKAPVKKSKPTTAKSPSVVTLPPFPTTKTKATFGLRHVVAAAALVVLSRKVKRKKASTKLSDLTLPKTPPQIDPDPIITSSRLPSQLAFQSQPSRGDSRCQNVQRRRRRKGKCREGFFEEKPGSTKFVTWRTVDCVTRKSVPKKP